MDAFSIVPDLNTSMTPGLLQVLIVEDNPPDAELMVRHLEREGFKFDWQRVDNEPDYLIALETRYDLTLADWSLPQFSGLRALQLMQDRGLDWPFIIVSGGIGEEAATAVMRQGASDYVLKDHMGRLGQAVKNALEQRRLRLEYQKTAEALAASEAELRALFASMNDVVLVLDHEGTYLKIAPTHPDLLIKPPEELLGKNLREVFPELQAAEFIRTIQKVLETQQIENIVYDLFLQDRPIWFEASISPLSDKEVVWMARDVSKRKQAELALEKQNRTLLSLHEIAIAIGGELDLSALLQKIMASAVDLLDADRGGGIYLYEQEIDALRLVEGAGINKDRVGIIVDVNEGMAGRVFRTSQPLIVRNYTQYEELSTVLVASPPSTVLSVPLLIQGQVIGALNVVANSEQRLFSAQDLQLAEMFAAQAAISIQNAKLYEATQRQISERVQAEELLRASEERFRSLYENATVGMYRTTPNGRILIANPATVRMLGYNNFEDLSQRNLEQEGFEPDYTRSQFRQLIETQGEVLGLESAWKKRDGNTIFVRESARAIRDQNGKVLYYEGTVQDITETKKASDALRESEERFRSTFEQAAVGIAHVAADGHFLRVNQRFCDIVGYSPEEMLTKRFQEISNPDDLETDLAYLRQMLSGQIKTYAMEKRNIRKDGSLVWVNLTVSLVRQSNGEPKYTISVVEDITARKQVEDAVKLSEARYRSLIETQSDIIARSDLVGNLTFVNDAYCRAFGQSRTDLLGKSFVASVFPEDLAISLEALEAIKKPPYRKQTETRQSTTQGIRYFSWDNSAVLDAEGNIIEFQGVGRDITERKNSEQEQARQAEELSRLYRATGALLTDSPFDIQSLAQSILSTVLNEFGQANCSVFLIEKNSNKLICLASSLPSVSTADKVELLLDGPGLVALAARSGHSINAPDVQANAAYVSAWEMARSELTIPLMIGEQMIGVIDIESAQPNAFSAGDERLMTIFADRAALVLEHARLNRETERRMQNLTALRTIDMAIASSIEIHLTLDILLDQLVKQLGVHAANVLIYNPVTQTLRFSTGQGFRTQSLQHTDLRFGDGNAWQAVRQRQVVVIQDLTSNTREFSRSHQLAQEGFMTYIGVPLIAKGQIKGVLEIFQHKLLELDEDQNAFLDMLGGQAAIAIDNAELFENLQGSNAELMMAYDETIEGWSQAMDLRDKETEGHSQRVTALTVKLAASFGLTAEELLQIRRGALLHDIGKLGVPDEILRKTGPLTDEEWVHMRKHPQFAYDMLAPITYLHQALDIPYCHHERWDGSGYPRGLKENQIPLAARIFAVVDVWDALTSERPYRPAWSREKVLAYIQEQAGIQFDPRVVAVFLQMVTDLQ